MTPRRSRFTRIYRTLTRTPNRHKQWNQIMTLRSEGSLGHPTHEVRYNSQVCDPVRAGRAALRKGFYPTPPANQFETGEWSPEPAPEVESSGTSGIAIAALAISLFLLACGYAAFSGFMHSSDAALAYLGILGAVGSLMAAGVGVCLAASTFRRPYSGKFLSLCVIIFAALYGMLLFLAMGR
ncbi:MAG TPA: hypothetical protein VN541_22570 [Tepidisphaeraceae bacterium]|nr:hypothetical protein [Tepidisphaeraceae bacterium]